MPPNRESMKKMEDENPLVGGFRTFRQSLWTTHFGTSSTGRCPAWARTLCCNAKRPDDAFVEGQPCEFLGHLLDPLILINCPFDHDTFM